MATRPPQLIGESPAFHRLMDQISDLAALERPITLTGERGTGKGLLAARLHFLSPRWEQGFFTIDCSTLYKETQASLLFGDDEIDGMIMEANNGTLMIDHIDHLCLSVQKRLLHLIESKQILPSGGGDPVDANVRIIAATRNNLAEMMQRGLFDPDLLDRLAFAHIHIPPLRERREDLLPLVQYFGRHMAGELGADSFPGFTPEVLLEMETQAWSGNIGELKTAVERSVAESFLADETLTQPIQTVLYNPLLEPSAVALPFEIPSSLRGATITTMQQLAAPDSILQTSSETVPTSTKIETHSSSATSAFHDRVMTFERALIDEAMRVGDGHQGKAAAHLEMSYHAFRGLLRKHGLKK